MSFSFQRSGWMQAKLDWYAGDHVNRVNHAIHQGCIPVIVFSVMGLLGLIPPKILILGVPFGWPELALAALLAFYAQHDLRLALLAVPIGAVMVVLARHVPWPIHAALFAAAWIAQFIGHGVYEKNKPSLMANLVSLFIAPAFLLDGLMAKAKL